MENNKYYRFLDFIRILNNDFLYTIKYYFYKNFLGFKNKVWHFTLCALLVTVIDFYMMKTISLLWSIIINNIIWLLIICFYVMVIS